MACIFCIGYEILNLEIKVFYKMLSNNNMFFERCDLSNTAWTDMVFQQWRPLGCGCLTPQQNTKSATVSLLPGHTKLCVCTYLTNISLYFFMIYCVSFAVLICVSFVKVMNVFFFSFFYRGQICLRLSLYRLTSCI